MRTIVKLIAKLYQTCGSKAVHAVTPKPSPRKLDRLAKDIEKPTFIEGEISAAQKAWDEGHTLATLAIVKARGERERKWAECGLHEYEYESQTVCMDPEYDGVWLKCRNCGKSKKISFYVWDEMKDKRKAGTNQAR